MTYALIYEPDFKRIIYSVVIDGRAAIPEIKNKDGFTIKAYIDNLIGAVTDSEIVYKIETKEGGVLAGYFIISVNSESQTATLVDKRLRPAFYDLSEEIYDIITNFIYSTKDWQNDYLF